MISDESKYYCLSGDCPLGGPSTWHVIDWDQRRVISVTMDGEQDSEDLAIQNLSRIDSSKLPRDIYRIYVSDTGEIISRYSDPKNDATCCVHYPFLGDMTVPEGTLTIQRDKLEELERLGPDVDLVAYPPCQGPSAKKVVFKYYWLWQYGQGSWKEMSLWMRLPRNHPNIVPFDRIVVDELEGRVVGFTTTYVPGGNLEENTSRVFKLEWLRQLINVVDELNLQYGIAHQDIAPRNLVVDESTDSIMLFDFNYAARINYPPLGNGKGEHYDEERNDVKGLIFTTYEIITQDQSFRNKPHIEQNTNHLPQEWRKHPKVELDCPVASYQSILQEWEKRRTGDLAGAKFDDFPKRIDWPTRPDPPQKIVVLKNSEGKPVNVRLEQWDEKRQDVLARGGKVLNWERLPQKDLNGGVRVLSNGELIRG
ncbi:hypothetical protein QBC40DRAFT_339588 [Triangularia verruculosa]|uniref:Protein kinase domain-containing protein n=1 Tax=Triangularia verruculosa TaxID=2587418 RepID=A0AAN7AWA4_9PEZI|nr:hypothetical protein QBC40DRAFT_339588 [Triangularia verruculosa]